MAKCTNCGASVSEYSSSCPQCGATFTNSKPMGLGMLTFFLKILLIYMPFVFLGFGTGIYLWLFRGMGWQIGIAGGLGAFAVALIAVKMIGKAADALGPPVSIPLRLIEVVLACGIQFLFFFSVAYGFFIPQDIQRELMEKQITFVQDSSFVEKLQQTLTPEELEAIQAELKSGNLDLQGMINRYGSDIDFKEMARIGVTNNLNYFKNMFGELRGEKGGAMMIGLLASLAIALVLTFFIWKLYRRGR